MYDGSFLYRILGEFVETCGFMYNNTKYLNLGVIFGGKDLGKLYDITLEDEKDTLFVKVRGFFKEEDAKVYLSEFQTMVNTIDPSNYTLIVDAREQEPVEKNVMGDIIAVLNIYLRAKFKKLIIVNPTSQTLKKQVEKCVKEVDFKGTFVCSLEEAYNL